MGFPPLLNLSTRLSTAALPGQTTKTALTEEFMFQNVAYRPTVYRTGEKREKNERPEKPFMVGIVWKKGVKWVPCLYPSSIYSWSIGHILEHEF